MELQLNAEKHSANMTMICSSPQCFSDGSSELRKLPLGPGRWDGSVTVCRQCYLKRNMCRDAFGGSPLPDWEKLAVVKEKQNRTGQQ